MSPPATVIGEIKAPYVVVHDMGTVPAPGSKGMLGQHLYEVICLAPVAKQKELSGMVAQVRTALAPFSSLKYTGDSQPTSALLPDYKGASMSTIYSTTCRLA